MNTPDLAHLPVCGTARLEHWGLIRVRGEDAVKFLQGQLTNDVTSMTAGAARLAGFCSAKGRLQASFLVWKADGAAAGDVLLACSASLLAPTLKRLSMFVMRAKCRLEDASAEWPIWGLIGAAVPADLEVWQTRPGDGGGWTLRLPDAAGRSRGLQMSGVAPDFPSLPLDTWRWLEVQSGIPTVEAATVERFVPQMLNYELVGGVDFRKGCYPGQEVVARSQYRGTLKRRSFLFDVDASAVPGQEVFHSEAPEQPAGMVVNAAPWPQGAGFSALVEVKLATLLGGSLHLDSSGGPVLRQSELPYPVPREGAEAP